MNPGYKPQNLPVSHNYVKEDGVPDFKAQTKDPTSRQFVGAAVAGGVAGAVVAGPIGAAAGAVAGAAATTTPGMGGDIVRYGAEGVAKLGEKVKEMNEKHHLQDKAKVQVQRGVDKAKKMNQRHQISVSMSKASGKAAKGMLKGASWVAKTAIESMVESVLESEESGIQGFGIPELGC